MKILTIVLLSLFTFTFSSRADVLVYKNKITGRDTGGGVSTKFTAIGYTIIDPEAANFPQVIWAFAKSKTFFVLPMDGCQLDLITGPGKKQSTFVDLTVISQASAWVDNNGFEGMDTGTFKGVDVDGINVGTTNLWSVPKTFNWIGRSIFPNANGESVLEESSGTIVLDFPWSRTCNSFGDTAEAALNRMKTFLLSQGYTEL